MHQQTLHLQPEDNTLLQNLCGYHNEYITTIEHHFSVQINHRGFNFKIQGEKPQVEQATQTLKALYKNAKSTPFNRKQIHLTMLDNSNGATQSADNHSAKSDIHKGITIEVNKKPIKITTPNQIAYLKALQNKNNTITFAIGPAGTGKTFLAIVMALKMLKEEKYKRIILTRPVVEAGEQLGFLPGDLIEKTFPYLQPLYDAMYQIINKQEVHKMIENNIIEIVPLAFMRGRTLSESFIILDEAQNTTNEQMKMFLTRVGYDSKVAITGDSTQLDIPAEKSGLNSAQSILKNIEGIDFIHLQPQDVRRHKIVQLITQAYEGHAKQ
jgi:phosphate starvation-inducible PhoH-like protein